MKAILLPIFLTLILTLSLLFSTGCSSLTDATEVAVGSGAGAAGAGAIGYVASHGNLMTTAISGVGGALGGGLLTSLFQSNAKKKKLEEEQKGYDLGKSDTAKSLYWVARSLQKPKEEPNEVRDQFLEAMQEPQPNATINTVSYAITLPVQEP